MSLPCSACTLVAPTLFAWLTDETAARSNPERQVWVHHDTIASAISAMPVHVITDDCIDHSSQANVLTVKALMDCEDGYECSVQKLPQSMSVIRYSMRVIDLTLLVFNELKMPQHPYSKSEHHAYHHQRCDEVQEALHIH